MAGTTTFFSCTTTRKGWGGLKKAGMETQTGKGRKIKKTCNSNCDMSSPVSWKEENKQGEKRERRGKDENKRADHKWFHFGIVGVPYRVGLACVVIKIVHFAERGRGGILKSISELSERGQKKTSSSPT